MRQSPPKSKQHMGDRRVNRALAIADEAADSTAITIQRVTGRRAPKDMGYQIGIKGDTMPQIVQVVNLCRSNATMRAWFKLVYAALSIADDERLTPEQGVARCAADPSLITQFWNELAPA